MKSPAAEAFAAEQMAGKLIDHLEHVQRIIAERCDPMCPFNAESNLIGQMAALLRERRYQEIHAKLTEWQGWLDECSTINRAVTDAVVGIRLFCSFYESTNGAGEP